MSFIITPICMTIASFCWYWLDNLGFVKQHDDKYKDKTGLAYFAYTVMHSFWLFLNSFWTGAKIIFSSRDFFLARSKLLHWYVCTQTAGEQYSSDSGKTKSREICLGTDYGRWKQSRRAFRSPLRCHLHKRNSDADTVATN
jgi:hypothetical protein